MLKDVGLIKMVGQADRCDEIERKKEMKIRNFLFL